MLYFSFNIIWQHMILWVSAWKINCFIHFNIKPISSKFLTMHNLLLRFCAKSLHFTYYETKKWNDQNRCGCCKHWVSFVRQKSPSKRWITNISTLTFNTSSDANVWKTHGRYFPSGMHFFLYLVYLTFLYWEIHS